MTDTVSLEFTSPTGEPLRFDWPLGAISALDGSETQPIWRLAGELDWDQLEAVRVLTARLGDGRGLALVALRPAGARGHGDDAVAGLLIADGETESLAEALISTEYGPDRRVRRVGLELYRHEDGLALRVAADATATEERDEGGVRRERVALRVRAGEPGAGILEILSPR